MFEEWQISNNYVSEKLMPKNIYFGSTPVVIFV